MFIRQRVYVPCQVHNIMIFTIQESFYGDFCLLSFRKRGKGMRRHWGVTDSTTMFGFAWLMACMTVELRRQCRQADCKGILNWLL